MLRHKVHYSRKGNKAFFLTYPKHLDGTLDTGAYCVSIIVNPIRMYEITLEHFNKYVSDLRSCTDSGMCENFVKLITAQWDIGAKESIIGMTEAEFLGNA